MPRCIFGLLACSLISVPVSAEDHVLTIGGGYSPSGNQASLERNVLFFQRLLKEQGMEQVHHDIFFADGTAAGADLQVMDRPSVPKANRLMAEFFGSEKNLGLTYRNHQVPQVQGGTSPANIRNWFKTTGKKLKDGDRLLIYVTAHGNRSSDRRNEHDTTIATWNNKSIKMTEFVKLLDQLPQGVEVIAVMVQCHAGGFARFMFNGGDPDRGLSKQRRIGFFATVHDRQAAGCTPEIDEASYVEYSSFFWAALGARDRSGKAIPIPDYDQDGVVSFEEAHAYVILTADTIDLPVKTSGEFLTVHSKFSEGKDGLLTNDESYQLVLELATASQKAILEGLSKQLSLAGNSRIVDAWKATQTRRGSGRNRQPVTRGQSQSSQLRGKILSDLKRRWPALANVLNPVAIELITTRSDEFVEAIEDHPDYQRYRKLILESRTTPNAEKRKVKYDRFLRTVDNVLMAENLRRMNDPAKIEQYDSLLKAEAGTLKAIERSTLEVNEQPGTVLGSPTE
ncbi:MAG: hypothetical protein OSA98_09390 [Rubripirellula sp.]|nr:hypothetical protein [Rubripirellula sp.]